MKASYRIAIVLAMVMSLFAGAAALAQGGLTYESGVQVVNLEASSASITLLYYDQLGNVIGSVPDTIGANGSKTYYPLSGVPAGFNGSMVISADRAIAAIANTVTSGNVFSASTPGFSGGSTTFSLPLVMCNNSGFNTFFNVQNAGTSDANVTVNYIPASDGLATSEAATIKPGAAKTFDQTTGSATKDCGDSLAGPTGKFIGSAKITSSQPVVATLMQLNTTSYRVLMGYNGFTGGSTVVNLPLVMGQNNSFYTGIQIQNAGTVATTVTMDYTANTGGSFDPASEVFSLQPGASKTIIQNGTPPSNGSANNWNTSSQKYIGGARITNDQNQPLVAIVNQQSPGLSGAGPFGTSYEGFDPALATANISAPLIMAQNSGYYTAIQVQNISATTCASVTIDYSANTGGSWNPVDESFSLAGYTSKTVFQNGSSPSNGSANTWSFKYIGSAEIKAPGCQIVAIINETRFIAGDQMMTYDGLNH